jgi:(p)ppGpp synthase/HD superfamily hydrolase
VILPPLRRTAADARTVATVAHDGQVDKGGRPYIEHLARVAAGVLGLSEGCPFWSDLERDEALQAAWLHDVVEDTRYGFGDLAKEGFSDNVLTSVAMLTKPGGRVTYAAWINNIAKVGTLRATLVKLADLEDNSDPGRLALLPAETRERLHLKYEPAKAILRAAAAAKGWLGSPTTVEGSGPR